MPVKVKVCGITNIPDALAAANLGADMVGFVFAKSPRMIAPEIATQITSILPESVEKVGVFVNEPADVVRSVASRCGLTLVQLHGEQTPEFCPGLGVPVIKSLRIGRGRVPDPGDWAGVAKFLLLDTYVPGKAGGTGETFDWGLARGLAGKIPFILAGGLGPDNVASAIRAAKPFAVDAASGLEISPGRKDHEKMARFIRRAKEV